jgi:hypothetical protein
MDRVVREMSKSGGFSLEGMGSLLVRSRWLVSSMWEPSAELNATMSSSALDTRRAPDRAYPDEKKSRR